LLYFCSHLRLFYEYQHKFVANIAFLFCSTKHFPQITAIFIEIYSQIRVFSEFGSKKRAKTISRDTIAIKIKKGDSTNQFLGLV
jgi:hypothetical protein